ncbi:hypothetical protein ACEPPN_018081 [Leptodophora sp. 'Broadleaf-Isolate-01']
MSTNANGFEVHPKSGSVSDIKDTQCRRHSRPSTTIEGETPHYTYTGIRAIHEFRLLELQPGQGNDSLHGRLFHANLDSAPDFQAISYVWGSDVMDHTLDTPDGTIPLTASLNSALKRFRKVDAITILWADALCINQNDDQEKGHQVRMMRRVYDTASKVLAHLGGDADDHTWDVAIDILALMYLASLSLHLPLGIPSTWVDGAPPSDDERWDNLADLFELPWFERVWVIQEVLVSKSVTIFVGRFELPWDMLFPAAKRCRECTRKVWAEGRTFKGRRYPETDPLLVMTVLKTLPVDSNIRTLLSLIGFYLSSKATRTRDHLFAVLGLATDGDDSDFDPDYTAPFEVVVKRYAAAFIRKGLVIELITHAGLRPNQKSADPGTSMGWLQNVANRFLPSRDLQLQRPDRFPSWVPDWTKGQIGTLADDSKSTPRGYQASGEEQAQAHMGERDDELIIKGIVVDTVTELTGYSTKDNDEFYLLEIASLIDKKDDPAYPLDPNREDLKWQIPIGCQQHVYGDKHLEASTAADHLRSSYETMLDTFVKKVTAFLTDAAAGVHHEEALEAAKGAPRPPGTSSVGWIYSIRCKAFGMNFPEQVSRGCRTERGLVEIVPASTRVGDRIWAWKVEIGFGMLCSWDYAWGGLEFEGVEEQDFVIH